MEEVELGVRIRSAVFVVLVTTKENHKMAVLNVQRTMPHNVERVWAVLSDFPSTMIYNPEVLKSESVNGLQTGLGARRRCEFDPNGKKWTEEQIVAFDDAAKRFTLRIEGGTAAPPIDDVRAEMVAEALGPDETLVTVTTTLNGSGLKQRLVIGAGTVALRGVFRRVLAGLDHHLSTGAHVTDRAYLKAHDVRI